jgi:hypothetical protein
LSVLGNFTTGGSPFNLILSGTSCVVTTATPNGTIQGFDINTLGSSGAISGLENPFQIAFSGTTGAVSCSGGTVILFDITQPTTITGSIGPFNGPSNIAINSQNLAVIENSNNVEFASYNPAGSRIIIPSGVDPTFLANNENTLVVVSGSDSIISIANMNTGALTGSITLPSGSNPQYAAISGKYAAVSCQDSGQIVVIDTNLNQIVGSINIGGELQRVALNGNIGAVGNTADNTVSTFDISTMQVINTYQTGNGPYRVAIDGNIGVTSNRLSNNVTVFSLTATPIPNDTLAVEGVTGLGFTTAEQLDVMAASFDWSAETAILYAEYVDLAQDQGIPALNVSLNDSSSNHKVIQYQIEKLDLLLHKEIDGELYSDKEGTRGFVLAGYDNFSQDSVNGYPGYRVDHYYQLLGGSYSYKDWKFLGAFGVSESYEKLNPSIFKAKASYTTLWGDLGGAIKCNRWHFGLDGLFGYSFIDAHREIQYLNRHIKTSHGMWNVSVDGRASYSFEYQKLSITPYDNLGYIYGHENDYQEHGSAGANLAITNENISMIRNQFGIRFSGPVHKTAFNVFMDGAWVYEYYFGDNTYNQRFIGSTIVAEITQTVPTKNYGRIHTGLEGSHKNFDWKLAYTGLFGKNLSDSAVSVKFGYKF